MNNFVPLGINPMNLRYKINANNQMNINIYEHFGLSKRNVNACIKNKKSFKTINHMNQK